MADTFLVTVASLAKYIARSPRYVLQPHDNTLIRLSGPEQTPWEEDTEIYNVSLTGLAFSAPTDLCPVIGETIKIQFEIPEYGQMAALALVIRLQSLSNAKMLVAVKFIKLDMAQRLALTAGLTEKLKRQAAKDEQQIIDLKRKVLFMRKAIPIALLSVWLLFLLWLWIEMRS